MKYVLLREYGIIKSSFEFLKRLAPAINKATAQSRAESEDKKARQEREDCNQLPKKY